MPHTPSVVATSFLPQATAPAMMTGSLSSKPILRESSGCEPWQCPSGPEWISDLCDQSSRKTQSPTGREMSAYVDKVSAASDARILVGPSPRSASFNFQTNRDRSIAGLDGNPRVAGLGPMLSRWRGRYHQELCLSFSARHLSRMSNLATALHHG